MELKFDRMFIPPGQIIPISAKVVCVPKFPVDKQGRIRGKGHPVRDTVEWMIPVLWPVDLINLPRRGPRPVLKAETRLTLKIMDDFGVPDPNVYSQQYYQAPRDQYGYSQRPAPMSYDQPPALPPQPTYQQLAYTAVPSATLPTATTVLMLRDGHRTMATNYWFDGATGAFRYMALNGTSMVCAAALIDIPATVAVNRSRGVAFNVPGYSY